MSTYKVKGDAFMVLFFSTIHKSNKRDLTLSKEINLNYKDEYYLTKVLLCSIFNIYRYKFTNVRELDLVNFKTYTTLNIKHLEGTIKANLSKQKNKNRTYVKVRQL